MGSEMCIRDRVFEGEARQDRCYKRRNRPQEYASNAHLFSAVHASTQMRKVIVYELQKYSKISPGRRCKSHHMEPHFHTSTAKSMLVEGTKTAAALAHCSECTKE